MNFTLSTQRYIHYITDGVPSSVLAPQPHQQMMKVMHLLPSNTGDMKDIPMVMANLEGEIKKDYELSLKKSIGIKQIKGIF